MATIPSKIDGVLLPWSLNFSTKITATPTVYDLTASEATAYAALHADFTTRLATAENPSTRTKETITLKNTSKLALLARARQFCKVIKASPTVTDGQRVSLGLLPRDISPTPVPAPVSRPLLVVDPFGNLIVRDETAAERRSRPTGTIGAIIYSAIQTDAAPAPLTPDQTRFAGLATRDKFAVGLPEGSTGKTLYVMAQWINGKGELGPVSAVVKTLIAA